MKKSRFSLQKVHAGAADCLRTIQPRPFLSSGFSVYKPSALQVRTFAKGCGIIAKNDKIDAEV